jgi:small-conductance mechanosensitive channel
LASFIIGFSFMISGASSDYFRGLLFILVQRPYDIGDRIAVAGPEDDASGTGSSGWIVKDVTL